MMLGIDTPSGPTVPLPTDAARDGTASTAAFYVHETAVIDEGALIGPAVKIWHFSHVRKGAVVGAGTQLGMGVYVEGGATIGRGCRVQNHVSVFAGVTIEDDVFVGPSVVFANDRYPRAGNVNWRLTPTRVCRGASIGSNATILCGVTIGPWAMVGAGAVVTRDVPAHRIVTGTPAQGTGWACRCARPLDDEPLLEGCGHGSA